eukprot:1678612-Ditylum_brightwellii.AAC.1
MLPVSSTWVSATLSACLFWQTLNSLTPVHRLWSAASSVDTMNSQLDGDDPLPWPLPKDGQS